MVAGADPIENLISFSSPVIPHITSESSSFPFHAGPIFVMKMKLVSLMSAIFFPFPAGLPLFTFNSPHDFYALLHAAESEPFCSKRLELSGKMMMLLTTNTVVLGC